METTKDFVPIPIDALAETADDMDALADEVERGLLDAASMDMPFVRVSQKEIPSTRNRTVHRYVLSSLAAIIGLVGLRLIPKSGTYDTEPIHASSASRPEPECCSVSIHMHEGRPLRLEIRTPESQKILTFEDTLTLGCDDGVSWAWIGKWNKNHEWIYMQTEQEDTRKAIFFCAEEGMYADCSQGSALLLTRSEFLVQRSVQSLFTHFPRITTGSKTPLSWGRDTSYGGKRGIDRINSLIGKLREEAQARKDP